MKRILIATGMLAMLAGCGAREDLKLAKGDAPPAKPYGVTSPQGSPDLLKPQIQTRPSRSDDLIQSTEKRRDDEFDLPPSN